MWQTISKPGIRNVLLRLTQIRRSCSVVNSEGFFEKYRIFVVKDTMEIPIQEPEHTKAAV